MVELSIYGVHKMKKIEYNIETGEIKETELTPAEVAELESEFVRTQEIIKVRADAEAQKAAEEAARLSAKLAIYAKLGLTEEEINTLIS